MNNAAIFDFDMEMDSSPLDFSTDVDDFIATLSSVNSNSSQQ